MSDLADNDLYECVDCHIVDDIDNAHGNHNEGLRCTMCNELKQILEASCGK